MLQAIDVEPDKIVKSVANISDKGGDIAMTTAEKLRQGGIQKGRQEGHQEGSYRTMVSLVHNAKKNGLSEEMISRIVNLDISDKQKTNATPTLRRPILPPKKKRLLRATTPCF